MRSERRSALPSRTRTRSKKTDAPGWLDLLTDYVACGLDPETFWRITPRELRAHFDGAVRRAKAEQKRLAWAVHQNAALARVEKFPALDRFLEPEPQADTMSRLRTMASHLPKTRIN